MSGCTVATCGAGSLPTCTDSQATSAKAITPTDTGSSDVQIASIYVARLRVSFGLRGRFKHLWGDELLRTKRFAASTYMGAAGSTSACW